MLGVRVYDKNESFRRLHQSHWNNDTAAVDFGGQSAPAFRLMTQFRRA